MSLQSPITRQALADEQLVVLTPIAPDKITPEKHAQLNNNILDYVDQQIQTLAAILTTLTSDVEGHLGFENAATFALIDGENLESRFIFVSADETDQNRANFYVYAGGKLMKLTNYGTLTA